MSYSGQTVGIVRYHENDKVNKLFVEGRDKNIPIEKMFEGVEKILGSRGTWGVVPLISRYSQGVMSFGDMVSAYLRIEVGVVTSVSENSEREDMLDEYLVQKQTYQHGKGEDCTEFSRKQVCEYVKRDVFRNCVFLSDDRETFREPSFITGTFDEERSQAVDICNILLRLLDKQDYSVQEKVMWWISYRDDIRKRIQRLRGHYIKSMSSSFKLEFLVWSKNTDRCPSFAEFVKFCDGCDEGKIGDDLLDLNIDKDIFRVFLDTFLSVFYPKLRFRDHMKHRLLSEVVTTSEEAFAILVLENNYKRWKWMSTLVDLESESLTEPQPLLVYQENLRPRKDGKPNAGDWTEEGLARMNELYDMVDEKRNDRKDFEKDLMRMYVSGISEEELTSGWMESINAKRKRQDKDLKKRVKVKNRLKDVVIIGIN